jgi:two-component system, OmpR family, sensor histidine kinase ArlS
MPVRLRITFLFTLVVAFILGIVCVAIYYFSNTSRVELIRTRLTNRAITTVRLLTRSGVFDRDLVAHIDSLTTISLKNKSVQAYNYQNKLIYSYSDVPGDTLIITDEILDDARVKQRHYFTKGEKEAVAYHYTDQNARIVIVCAARDELGRKNIAQLESILLLSFFAGIAIALIGGYFFSGRLLQPIRNIVDEVADISAHNFARRIHTGTSRDEWHQLSTTLNDLLNRLQESFELQRRFISNASHELSTPLTSISTQLEISLQRERTEGEYRKTLQSVLEDVQRMNKLTQTLLEFAKATGDKGGLSLTLARIDEIVLEIPAVVQKQNADWQVALRFDVLPENEEDLLVFGNSELLFTALKNIVINACKYSPDHRAEIGLTIHDKEFRIVIADKGIGIAARDIANIFQPFYRADESRTTEGFGLGLPLAYRIIKLHKGDITVSSEEGKGTIFTIVIPSGR